jgi:hypothetical protein
VIFPHILEVLPVRISRFTLDASLIIKFAPLSIVFAFRNSRTFMARIKSQLML